MGEHRRNLVHGIPTNGHLIRTTPKRIRVVANIRIENAPTDRLTMLMLGDKEPELAVGMTPQECRTLAEKLIEHAEANEGLGSGLILPGGPSGE